MMSGTPLLKHDTLLEPGLLSREMQSLIVSLLLQKGGKGGREASEREREGGGGADRREKRNKCTVRGRGGMVMAREMEQRHVDGGASKEQFFSGSVRSCNLVLHGSVWISGELEQREEEPGNWIHPIEGAEEERGEALKEGGESTE